MTDGPPSLDPGPKARVPAPTKAEDNQANAFIRADAKKLASSFGEAFGSRP